MLELNRLSVWRGGERILRDVSLAFRPGELLAIIGPNGSGKSTLLRAAAGLYPRDTDAVTLDGVPLRALSAKEIARNVAWLPQSRNTPDITAWRMVLHGRFPHMQYPRHIREEDKRIAARALEAVDAANLSERLLRDLSGGERQKIYLAATLARQCDIILMDEPTTYLDISCQFQIISLAKGLAAEGKAVAAVLHDLPIAFGFADRIAILRDGELARMGTPEELLEQDIVTETFGVSLRKIWDNSAWRYYYASGRFRAVEDGMPHSARYLATVRREISAPSARINSRRISELHGPLGSS